jgi:hypothetical protein
MTRAEIVKKRVDRSDKKGRMSDTASFSRDAVWGVGAAILLFIVMIALAVAWVTFFSYVIEPGHDPAFYEAHAQVSSPIVSVVAGGPVFWLVAFRLARGRAGGRTAWIAAFLYLLIDLAILIAAGALPGPVAPYFLAGAAMKVGGTALGVRHAKA